MKLKYSHRFWFLICIFTIYRIWYISANILDLVGDEAHYWEWSRNLDINYYSKGPLVAYIINFFTCIGGDTPLFVRMGAVFISVLFAWVVYRFSLELFGSEKIAFYTVLTFELMPIFFAGGIFMTIDPPFLFFWLCSLFFIYKGLVFPKTRYWVLFGLCAGTGFLAKYTMFLIYPLLWLYLSQNKGKARKAGIKNIILAHGISLLFVFPFLYWNITHNWATFKHVSGQIKGGSIFHPLSFLELLGSQAAVVSPLIFAGILIVYVLSYLNFSHNEFNFLFWFSAPVLGLFAIRSLFGRVQGNWPAPAYVASVFALTAAYFGRLPIEKGKNSFFTKSFFDKRWACAGLTIAGIMVSAGSFPKLLEPVILPFARPGRSPIGKLAGWEELGNHIEKILRKEPGAFSFVFSDSYHVTSELAFYNKSRYPTLCANLGRRQNQYDYWPGFENFIGRNGIFVKEAKDKIVPKLKEGFEKIIPLPPLILKRKKYLLKAFYIYKCINLRGFEKVERGKRTF